MISQLVVTLDNAISIKLTRRIWRPVWAWEAGARDEASTEVMAVPPGRQPEQIGHPVAWIAPATLPLAYLRRMRKCRFVSLPLMEIADAERGRYRGEIGAGIGVNSGRVVAGTVGGGGRVEVTSIGDTVNTAARVEAITRETGDDVLITEATRERVCSNLSEFEERPPVPLKGKSAQVRLWAPPGLWAPRALVRAPARSESARAPVPD